MTYTDSVLELTGVTKRYSDQTVLDELDLTVGGGVFALLGPNGAGKTTMINILSTLIRPDAGTARVLGHDVVTARSAVQQLIGVTGQYAAVDEALTGMENLIMMGRLVGLPTARARTRAGELLEQFDLVDAQRRQVKAYCGGMRRRLDLAVSLIRAPRVIFLDEPTTGLDTRSRQALWDEVRALSARETAIVLTTQYLDEADALADRVGVLHRGRIIADGSPSEFKALVQVDPHPRIQQQTTLRREPPGQGLEMIMIGQPEPASRVRERQHTTHHTEPLGVHLRSGQPLGREVVEQDHVVAQHHRPGRPGDHRWPEQRCELEHVQHLQQCPDVTAGDHDTGDVGHLFGHLAPVPQHLRSLAQIDLGVEGLSQPPDRRHVPLVELLRRPSPPPVRASRR